MDAQFALSSGAQPQRLVEPGARASASASPRAPSRPGGADHRRPRRHARAPARGEDQGQGHLPRSGALLARPLRQGLRPALALAHAAGARALREPRVGAPVPDRARPLGALPPGARQAAQDAPRLGSTDLAAAAPLAARPPHRRGDRHQLRRARAPRSRARAGRCHHPFAPRRQPLRAGGAAAAGPDRPAAPQGRTGAEARAAPRPGRHALAAGRRAGLVRRGGARGRHRLGRPRLGPCPPARRAALSGPPCGSRPGRRGVPIRWVLVRDPGGKFKPQAFLCTDETVDPTQILRWFVLRWRLEVTFEEGRRHLGVETQRQWSDKAITRTTPALLALFSLVALWAGEPLAHATRSPRRASWYAKPELTFSDALAAVRQCLWWPEGLATSRPGNDVVKVPRALLERLTDTLCYAA